VSGAPSQRGRGVDGVSAPTPRTSQAEGVGRRVATHDADGPFACEKRSVVVKMPNRPAAGSAAREPRRRPPETWEREFYGVPSR
jgi:hypothetical protein